MEVPQVSIWLATLFLTYVNKNVSVLSTLYTDDTTLLLSDESAAFLQIVTKFFLSKY